MTHFLKLSYHSCLLRLLNSGEENETNSYVILIVAMNALISCNFEKNDLALFKVAKAKGGPLVKKVGIWVLNIHFSSLLVSIDTPLCCYGCFSDINGHKLIKLSGMSDLAVAAQFAEVAEAHFHHLWIFFVMRCA